MLDFRKVLPRISEYTEYYRKVAPGWQAHIDRLMEVLRRRWTLEEVEERVHRAAARRLVALPRTLPLDAAHPAPSRPPEVTVVATDGSQILPERGLEPPCFLLNVGKVAFHYGTTLPPLMTSEPTLHFGEELLPWGDEGGTLVRPALVSALRDERELQELLELARSMREEGRPLVALLDGTLIRWMVRGLQESELEQRLIERYVALLEAFEHEGIPLASYISQPGGGEVVNLLHLLLEEDEAPLPWLMDRWLFARLLTPGTRSAVFRSGSHIQAKYGAQAICFFYLHVGDEMARVEFPAWMLEHPEALDLVHAVLMDQVRKGRGYPVALAEAHEQAVVRAEEQRFFFELLELKGPRKALAKRIPRL